jgi:hypothetical protein
MAYEVATASNLEDLYTRILRFLQGYGTSAAPGGSRTGNGTLSGFLAKPAAVTETWTLTCTAAAANSGTFSVVGSVSGAQAAATVGVAYSNTKIQFTILDGSTDFIVGDVFTVAVTIGMMPSVQRWQVLREFRDNVVGLTTNLVEFAAGTQNRRILHGFRYDARSLGWNDTGSDHGHVTTSSYVQGISQFTIQLRAAAEARTVRVQAVLSSFVIADQLQNFLLEWSDNGTSWTTAGSVTSSPTYTLGEVKTFSMGTPGAHLWWRVTVNRKQGGATTGNLYFKSFLLLDAAGLPINHFGSEALLKAPGTGGTDEIYTGIRTEYDAGAGWYNLFLNGYTGYDPLETSWFKQPGALPHFDSVVALTRLPQPMVPCWDSPMPYWFAANGRSFRFGVKVSTSFEGGYLGWILPYATPGQYPYPLAIGGSLVPDDANRSTLWRFSVNSVAHSVFPIPGCNNSPAQATENIGTSLYLRLTTGDWGFVGNRYSGGSADPNLITGQDMTNGSRRSVWPTSTRLQAAGSGTRDMRECLGGGYILVPLIIHQRLPTQAVFGELEGVYQISGFSNAAENTAVIGGTTHVVLQNVARTEAHEYWAIALTP